MWSKIKLNPYIIPVRDFNLFREVGVSRVTRHLSRLLNDLHRVVLLFC